VNNEKILDGISETYFLSSNQYLYASSKIVINVLKLDGLKRSFGRIYYEKTRN